MSQGLNHRGVWSSAGAHVADRIDPRVVCQYQGFAKCNCNVLKYCDYRPDYWICRAEVVVVQGEEVVVSISRFGSCNGDEREIRGAHRFNLRDVMHHCKKMRKLFGHPHHYEVQVVKNE